MNVERIVKGEVPQTSTTAKVLTALAAVVVLLVAFLGYGLHLASTPDGKARISERDAIDRCHAAQDDELSELSTRRIIRQHCEALEAAYRAKWNREP